MNEKKTFYQLDESIQEKYIEKAYHYLVEFAFMPLIDEPVEDNMQYDLICRVAEEMYNEENN